MSTTEKRKPANMPYFVRQAGLEPYGEEGKGAIVGFDNRLAADDDCYDRNERAQDMKLKARYEVVEN